jgi:hypothetical protein
VGQNATVAPDGHGVNITGGASNIVTNEGSIEGGQKPGSYWGYGIGITGGGEGHTIENYGTISSVRGAIDIADSNNMVIANEGNIVTSHLDHPQDNGYFSIGLRGGYGTITNETTGSIIGGNAAAVAIQGLSNSLINEGSITTTGQFGVLAAGEDNTITNSGTIEGGQNLSSLEEIQFIPLKAGIGILGNNNEVINEDGGTVSSSTSSIHDESTGILIYGTGNEIRNNSGGTITGGEFGVYIAYGANTIINSGDILSGKHGIMIQDGASSVVTNDGHITADNGYGVFIGSGSDNTSITNTGSISGGRGGIDAVGQGITITNETDGSIFVNDGGEHPWMGEGGSLYALGLGGIDGTIVNRGTITGGNVAAIGLGGTRNQIENEGEITTSGLYGVGIQGDENTVTNSGTISGSHAGIGFKGNNNVLINSGTITDASGNSYGVEIIGDGNVVNNASSGTIYGSVSGIVISGDSNEVTNDGNIEGGSYGVYAVGVSNEITNQGSGMIFSSGTGVYLLGSGNTLLNSGEVISTGDDSYGVLAIGGSVAENLNRLITRGDRSPGMYAYDGSTIYNNAGVVRTEGAGSHGMVADGTGSVAHNNANVVTTGDGAFGMYALNTGTVLNHSGGLVRTNGLGSHGMVADGAGSTATNEFGAEVRTTGADSFGMLATGGSVATNLGRVVTTSDGSHGMYAYGGSTIYNTNAGDNCGVVRTEGEGSHGMVADGAGSTAHVNSSNVVTNGDNAFGMYALNGGSVFNHFGGLVRTNGTGSHGMVADGAGSKATNEGNADVLTTGNGSFGMFAVDGSEAENLGRVVTRGAGSHGMYAYGGSTVNNNGSGVVRTEGVGSHGMVADGTGSVANNRSSVLTTGDGSFGMYALDSGEVINRYGATIRTDGAGSHGMVAQGTEAIATNETDANIRTTSDDSYGMYALDGALARNSGIIRTLGSGSHGMVAENGSGDPDDPNSGAYNNELIETSGDGSYGMYALNSSRVDNYDTIETLGEGSHGMVASGDSWAYNHADITTNGNDAFGMYALNSSFIYNYGVDTIETFGDDAHGMVADTDSYAYNYGSVITHGDGSFGMYAVNASSADNYGTVTTSGAGSHGMVMSGDSDGYNEGTVTVSGAGSDAVHVLGSSRFINAGILDAPEGRSAVAASDSSSVLLLDGTVLVHTHTLTGDGTSSLDVYMSEDLAAQVQGFGNMTKRGTGTLLVEEGSFTGDLSNEEGTLEIEDGTQFDVANITQLSDATLYVHANPDSSTMESAIPLWVSGDAYMDGYMRADMTLATGAGFYNFIRATYYEGEPETTFENLDPLFLAYGPAWVDGWDNDYHYRTLVGYSFSEAALGLVAAVDDWNMLRWIMGNHLQDVAENMKEMEVGERKIHAHALGGTTTRDPADSASAGFDSTQKGISVGFDKKHNENTVWGLYAGYTEKDIDFTGLSMVRSDWEKQDTWHIGAYISKSWDRWIFSNTLTYRSTDHDTFRKQMGGDATASFDSWAITNDLRLGYVAKEIGEGSNWQVIPEVGLNVGYFDRGGYTEKNGFTYGDFDTTVVESVLGIRFRGEYERADGSKFVPQARLAWVHVLSGNDVTIDQSWGGTTHWFTEDLDDDYFVADLGLSLYNMNDMDISLNYGGRFSDNSTTHGGWLRLEWRF